MSVKKSAPELDFARRPTRPPVLFVVAAATLGWFRMIGYFFVAHALPFLRMLVESSRNGSAGAGFGLLFLITNVIVLIPLLPVELLLLVTAWKLGRAKMSGRYLHLVLAFFSIAASLLLLLGSCGQYDSNSRKPLSRTNPHTGGAILLSLPLFAYAVGVPWRCADVASECISTVIAQ